MKMKDQFLREQQIRNRGHFDKSLVINILRIHDGEVDDSFSDELDRRGLREYPHCIVMPAGDKNLSSIIVSERIAASDWKTIKVVAAQCAEALKHMHERDLIHADIKPLNIMRMGDRIKLIDLDASAAVGFEYSGAKFSSAYLPPEMIYRDALTDKLMVKTFTVNRMGRPNMTGLPYQLVPASYSHDTWSLGIVLFELCAGSKLFPPNVEDNIDSKYLLDLHNFPDEYKREKLKLIEDVEARNLVSQMLMKDPTRRPQMNQVLAHPFLREITNCIPPRDLGEPAKYDVAISYRIGVDRTIAEMLSAALKEAGLTVWVQHDSEGDEWTKGDAGEEDIFFDGMVSSRIFLPIITPSALYHRYGESGNWDALNEYSDSDSLLLEYWLALELRLRGFVEKIYPVFVSQEGDQNKETVASIKYYKDKQAEGEDGSDLMQEPFFKFKLMPSLPHVVVRQTQDEVRDILYTYFLGSPHHEEMTVYKIVSDIVRSTGKIVPRMTEGKGLTIAHEIAQILEDRSSALMLGELPVHRAIVMMIEAETVLRIIKTFSNTLMIRDDEGKTAFDLALGSDFNDAESCEIITEILRHVLPVDIETGEPLIDTEKHGYSWVAVVQSDKYLRVVETILHENVHIARELSESTDQEGRPAINLAAPLCREVIKKATLFFRRFEITTTSCPHHHSATCVIHLAIDHARDQERVALKLFKRKDQFMREQQVRTGGNFSSKYVIDIIDTFDSDTNEAFNEEVWRRGVENYPYMLVMPAAERNLQMVVSSERIAGRDWDKIRSMGIEIAEALKHMHDHGVLHGDIKPLNIMRAGGRIKLIDLDAAANLKDGFAGAKFSSAYAPPELVHVTDDNEVCLKVPRLVNAVTGELTGKGLPFELVKAHHSFDSWSFGCVLYELCCGAKLFLPNDEDNIDEEDLHALHEFANFFKRRKLHKIHEDSARNLVAQLLSKDPTRRPGMTHVLAHPFLSGQKAPRMIGEEAEFDVFISYRVAAEKEHVEVIYNLLTEAGLNVWWDKKCLLPGVSWEGKTLYANALKEDDMTTHIHVYIAIRSSPYNI
jgi:serine/threonine protein kinase